MLKYDQHQDTNDFINTLGAYFFQPHILQPSRITEHSSTLIDNIFINSIDHILISGNLIYDISDHLPNFLLIQNLPPLQANKPAFFRDYSNLDETALSNEVKCFDWRETLSHCHDPNELFHSFNSTISNTINKHIPLIRLTRKQRKIKSKPWLTHGIKVSIRVKNKLLKKFLRTKSTNVQNRLKLYRNKLKHLIKLS